MWILCGYYIVFASDSYDITPPGTEEVIIGFDDATPAIGDSTAATYTITTRTAEYKIDRLHDTISCYQKIGYRKNLIIVFDNILSGIHPDADSSTAGYVIFKNNKIKLAFHSDGTLWAHVLKPGADIRFKSNIKRSYDKGGDKFEVQHVGGDPTTEYPVASVRIIKTNWMVITDEGAMDNITCTGGFGVYCRPAIKGGGPWVEC